MGRTKRAGFLLGALWLCGWQAALGGHIQVLSAIYGTHGQYTDVRERVQRLADRGNREFPVENDVLGADPLKGERKTLRVVYIAGGRRFEDSAREKDRFEFKAGGGWDSWSPWYQGQWPGAQNTQVDFRNDCGDRVFVYHVNDYGRWIFVRELFDGQGFSSRCPSGQTWIVTDPRNRILRQVQAGRCDGAVVIGRDRWNEVPHGGRVGLRFVNRTGREIHVFRVDQRGGWDRVAEIDEDDSENGEFYPGEPWMVTDRHRRLIASGRAGRESQRIEVRD